MLEPAPAGVCHPMLACLLEPLYAPWPRAVCQAVYSMWSLPSWLVLRPGQAPVLHQVHRRRQRVQRRRQKHVGRAHQPVSHACCTLQTRQRRGLAALVRLGQDVPLGPLATLCGADQSLPCQRAERACDGPVPMGTQRPEPRACGEYKRAAPHHRGPNPATPTPPRSCTCTPPHGRDSFAPRAASATRPPAFAARTPVSTSTEPQTSAAANPGSSAGSLATRSRKRACPRRAPRPAPRTQRARPQSMAASNASTSAARRRAGHTRSATWPPTYAGQTAAAARRARPDRSAATT